MYLVLVGLLAATTPSSVGPVLMQVIDGRSLPMKGAEISLERYTGDEAMSRPVKKVKPRFRYHTNARGRVIIPDVRSDRYILDVRDKTHTLDASFLVHLEGRCQRVVITLIGIYSGMTLPMDCE